MKPTTTRQLCAFQRGYQAAKAGKDKVANPHNRNTVSRTWWIRGFEAAEEALRQEDDEALQRCHDDERREYLDYE